MHKNTEDENSEGKGLKIKAYEQAIMKSFSFQLIICYFNVKIVCIVSNETITSEIILKCNHENRRELEYHIELNI